MAGFAALLRWLLVFLNGMAHNERLSLFHQNMSDNPIPPSIADGATVEIRQFFCHAISHKWIVGALELNPNFFAKLPIALDVSAGYEQRGEHVIRDMVDGLKAQCPGSLGSSLFPPASPSKEIASIAQEPGALGLA